MPESVVIDFTNVKDRDFNIKHLPPGDYPAKITKVIDHQAKSGNDNWLYSFTITTGPGKGAVYPYYAGLDTEQAWKIRNIYAACGVTIPKKKVRLKREQVLNRTCAVTLDDDEYEGKLKSVIAAVIPLSDIGKGDEDVAEADEDDEEVEETPLPRRRKAKPAAVVEAEEEEEAEDEDEDEEEAAPPPRRTKPKPAAAKAKPKPAVAEDDDDELEELELEDL
jgi:hypothetical protein